MLAYETYGQGPHKVLVLHDWYADHTEYDLLRPHLDSQGYTYVFADLRGYGRSKGIPGECTLEEAVGDVLALVDRLRWHRFSLVSHSMSGLLSQYIAAKFPERLQAQILIAPVGPQGLPTPEDVMVFLEEAARDNDESGRQIVHFMTGGRQSEAFAAEKVALWRRCSVPEARVAYLHMFTQTDISAQVQGCAVPTLVVVGAHDAPAHQVEVFEETLLKAFSKARMVVCPDAGHYPMVEAPAWLALQVQEFLMSVS